jgi:anti-sigma factor RsiW
MRPPDSVTSLSLDSCPGAETLAALLDDRLAADERDEAAVHMTTCESCYAVFLESSQIKRAATVRSPRRWPTQNQPTH